MPTIEFSVLEPFKEIPVTPLPAKKALPDWLKTMPSEINGMPTAKRCPPFTDIFSLGYVLPNWQEIELTPNGEIYNFRAGITHIHSPYENPRPVCSYQYPDQYKGTHLEGHQVIKFQTPWIIKTPPGVSIMVLPLTGHNDLPFEAIPAVIDTDTYHTNFGFTCKIKNKTLEPINLQPGVPLVQIIPFERTNWKMEMSVTSMLNHSAVANKLKTFIMSGYKKLFWKKKDFN